MGEAAQGSKARGGRVVPSRYLQYDRKNASKADISQSASKGLESAASTKGHPAQFQKQKSRADEARPGTALSKPNTAGESASRKQQSLMSADAEDLIQMLDSQTLLLTYASVKMERNLAALVEKEERNLLALLKERERLQSEAQRKKLRLLQLKKEQDLRDALSGQLEVLAPIAERLAKFHEEYKQFATSLDSTRHELPLKEIHTGENRSQYLADLQEHLTATQSVLKRSLREHSEHNAQVLPAVKELEETSLKLADELPRSFATVLKLSADVSKEVSLHHQKSCEDTLGLEAMKQYYFP